MAGDRGQGGLSAKWFWHLSQEAVSCCEGQARDCGLECSAGFPKAGVQRQWRMFSLLMVQLAAVTVERL